MEKTYVFDNNEGLNSSLIASLMQNKGVDPNLMAMLSNASRNQGAWGGEGCWFMWVILLFWLWGGNGNMFGRNTDGIPNQLNNDFGRDILLQAINGNGTAISQLASTLNCDMNSVQNAICQVQSSIQNVGNQVGMTGQQIINSIQNGNSSIASQLASCCCDLRNAITTQGYENQIATSNQTNALTNAMNCNNQAILARLDSMQNQALLDKIDALREKNGALTAQLSQEHQTAQLMASQQAIVAPVNATLLDLSSRLSKIECSLPPTVAVPYPQLQVYNPEVMRAAAFGAYAGDVIYNRRAAVVSETPTTT